MSESASILKPAPAARPVGGPPRTGTYALLDAARGVACLWVVCHHALGFLYEEDPSIAANPLYRVGLNGALGVWVFFVISGYCIANTAESNLKGRRTGWAMARLRRILPPCWFASGLCIASALLAAYLVQRGVLKSSHLADLDPGRQSLGFYVANFTLTQELLRQPYLSGVYWTLCYEVGFYAVVGAALYLSIYWRATPRRMLDCLHGVTLLSLLALVLRPGFAVYPFDLWPHFGLGVLLYDVLLHGWRPWVIACAALTAAGVATFFAQHAHRDTYLDRGGGVALLTAALTALLLLGLHRFDRRLSAFRVVRWLGWVGVFSYSLYLTHMTLIGYVYKGSQLAGLLPGGLPVYLALAVLVPVGFARVFFRFCEFPFLSGKRTGTVVTLRM